MSAFQVIPAVDILGGRGVRLRQGDFHQVTDYGDPVELAQRWWREGATWLHLVDLDGARAGVPAALDIAASIRERTGCRLQYGGGLRDDEAVRRALTVADRVIVSSWALREPEAVCALCAELPGRILISLDVRDGRVWVNGWRTSLDADPVALARRFVTAGAGGIIVTWIEGDGTLAGVPREAVRAVAAWHVPFFWAGGIATAEDVVRIWQEGDVHCQGAVVGRALYAGTTTLTEIMQRLQEASPRG